MKLSGLIRKKKGEEEMKRKRTLDDEINHDIQKIQHKTSQVDY